MNALFEYDFHIHDDITSRGDLHTKIEGKITSQNAVWDRDFFAIFWDFLDYFWDFFWIFGIFGIFLGNFWDLLDFFSEKCTGFFSSDFPLD